MTEGHRPEAHVNNKATYTEVCNLLVPWQQEMQFLQELQDCTCILQATCIKLLEITCILQATCKKLLERTPDLHETCRFDMLSNRSICYQIRSDMGFINLLLNNLIGQILQPWYKVTISPVARVCIQGM